MSAIAIILAASPLLSTNGCVVDELDYRGKTCTGDRCPNGLPCVQGICGSSDGTVDGSVLDDGSTADVDPSSPTPLEITLAGGGQGAIKSADLRIDCPTRCSDTFAKNETVVLNASPVPDSTFFSWTGEPCSGNALTCSVVMSNARNVTATFEATIADVDGDRFYGEPTDATLISRYMFGLTGDGLTNNAVGTNARRKTSDDIIAYLETVKAKLDVDGNGKNDALTDGLLIQRYMNGKRGSQLTQDAVASDATRNGEEIEAYIKSLMPPIP